jgi:signal peptidase II
MRVLYLTGLIVVIDQASKLLVKGFDLPIIGHWDGMVLGSSLSIIGNFFKLTFIENPGMAFGIDIGGKLYLTVFSTLASIGIVYYLFKIREEALIIRISLAMILGGAIGNLIDRLFYAVIFENGPLLYGKVVDFFDVDFFNVNFAGFHISRWPIFNVADAAVSVGVVMLLIFHRKFTAVEDQRMTLAPNGVHAGDTPPINEPQTDLQKEDSSNTRS